MSLSTFAITIDGIEYSLNISNRTASVAGSSLENVIVPETIDCDGITYNVTSISSTAFRDNTTIKTFKSSSIKEINGNTNYYGQFSPYGAFAAASNLEEVYLENVETIGYAAFYKAVNLKKIYVGNSLKTIGTFAFSNCFSLKYIVIPSSISSVVLGDAVNAFYGGNASFNYCPQLIIICLKEGFICAKEGFGATLVPQTIYPSSFFTFSDNTYGYNGRSPEVTYSFNGIGNGFQPTMVDTSNLPATAGNHTEYLHCTFANDDMSFNANIPYTYTINPAKLTANVKDASRLYGNNNPQFSSEYSGFVNNENASVVTSNGSYTTTATEKSDVGTYAIKQSGATAQNYVFEYEDGTLTVNKAPLTMTANDKTMTYGNSIPVFDISYEGLKNNETQPTWVTKPALSSTVTPTSNVGTYPITISNADAKNYDLTIHNGTLTVEKAELTAKVENKSRLYGDANPEFTLTYTGLKHNETVPAWEQEPTFETTATTQSNVGNYPVSLKNAVAVNYNITPVEGTLTVNKAPLKVTPKDCTRKYGEQNPQFELNYEGLKNSENQPEWTEEPVITTNATTGSSVGEYAITVKSAEARNYTLEKGSGTLTVTKAPVTIKLLDATRKYGTANPNFEMSYTGLIDGETTPAWTTYPTITTTAKEKSDVGDYAITAEGGELKNYEFDGITPGILSVTPASLVVRAQNASKSYFEENPMLSYLCTGFVQGDNTDLFTVKPQLSTTATLQSPVGIYIIEVGGGEIKNYQVSYVKGQLTVDKRTLTVSTNDYTRAYGEENPEFELTYKGFVNNEDENVLMAKPKASTVADKNTDTGVYDITIANGVAENYAFNYVGGKLTIEKAYQTLTWDQNLTGINLYDQVELTAKASSGLEVQYTLEPNSVCSLVKIGRKQYLDCFAEGEAVLIAQQEGNNNYWQTTKMYKSVKIGGDSGIDAIQLELDPSARIYNAQGKLIPSLQHGLNIIKMGDGTIKKVMVK